MGGKDIGKSIDYIALLLSEALMVFTWARTVAAHNNFFYDDWTDTGHWLGLPICN